MERRCSLDSILISIYEIDAYDPQKRKSPCEKVMKKHFAFEYEFGFINEPVLVVGTALK